jgi:hypothetical protein
MSENGEARLLSRLRTLLDAVAEEARINPSFAAKDGLPCAGRSGLGGPAMAFPAAANAGRRQQEPYYPSKCNVRSA